MKSVKIGLFLGCIVLLLVGKFVKVPSFVNNVIYGIMAIFGVLFLLINKEDLGLNDVFKKKENE